MATTAPFTPFNRQRRANEPAQDRTPLARKAAPPPPADLGLPNDGSFLHTLTGSFRNSVTDPPDVHDGADHDDDSSSVSDNVWRDEHHQPTRGLSVANGGAGNGFYKLAERVTSSVSSLASAHNNDANDGPQRRLSSAELEAEAIKEREHSRREAERILLQEAEERRRSEDAFGRQPSHLPPLRPRRSTIDIPRPIQVPLGEVHGGSPNQKSGWWSMAKQKLTPGKSQENVPLTPAQAVIRDAKIRERESSESPRGDSPTEPPQRSRKQSWFSPKDKEKERRREASMDQQRPSPGSMPLPVSPSNQNLSASPNLHTSPSHLVSPITPPRVPEASQTTQFNLSPTPAPRSVPVRDHSHSAHHTHLERPQAGRAPTAISDAPSSYTVFHPVTGALDVAATLLTVTARFEKLERWSVNHVRALEERMKDVERYLVDKEAKEAEVKRKLSLIRHDMTDMEKAMTEAQGALPAAVLSNLLMPLYQDQAGGEAPRAGAISPSSHGAAESAYYSATGSPSLVPIGGFGRSPSGSHAARERSYTQDSLHTPYHSQTAHNREETNGTVRASSHSRGPLPSAPRASDDARSIGGNSYHPSADPYTPPHPASRSALSLVSSSGSPLIPPPRAVSPLALSPMDIEGHEAFLARANSTRGDGYGERIKAPQFDDGRPSTSSSADLGRFSSDTARVEVPAPAPTAMDRSYTSSSSLPAPHSQASLSAPGPSASRSSSTTNSPSQVQQSPGSRAGSRGNSISPTPRKRYTVALSGRADVGASPGSTQERYSPLPEAREDDVVERVYGVGVSSNSNSRAGTGTRMKVHTAVFTSTPPSKSDTDFDFEESSELGGSSLSLAASLSLNNAKTPESLETVPPLRSSRSRSIQQHADETTDEEEEEVGEGTSPSTQSRTHESPGSSFTSVSAPEEKGLGRTMPPTVRSLSFERTPVTAPVEEVTEPESEADELEEKVDEEDEGLFKVGSTPIALNRIVSPPLSPVPPLKDGSRQGRSSPTLPSSTSSPVPRLRTQTLPTSLSAPSSSSTSNGGAGGRTSPYGRLAAGGRTPSPNLPSSAKPSIPRAFGGLGPATSSSADAGAAHHGSVSSMASASTSLSASSSNASGVSTSSAVTSSSGRSASAESTSGASSASASSSVYRTPAASTVRNSVVSNASVSDRELDRTPTTRPRAQTTLTQSSTTSAGGASTIRHTSPGPMSAGPTSSGFGSAAGSAPGSPGSDREAEVFASRSSSGNFVDPLVLRRKEKERRSMEVKANALAVARKATDLRPPGVKPPVGDLVRFFQAAQD